MGLIAPRGRQGDLGRAVNNCSIAVALPLLRSGSRSGKQLQADRLCAFVFNLEISRHCVRPNVQGVRLAGMAILEHPQLSRRPIELGLIVTAVRLSVE
jgi:hypothetical protein